MARHILFFREQSRVLAEYSFMMHVLGQSGFEPIVIDLDASWPDTKCDFIYTSLAEALVCPRLAGCTWVWFDPDGETILDEYEHPADNVIYCIGSDFTGFGEHAPDPANKMRIRMPEHLPVWWAVQCVQIICYDVLLYEAGRRA